MRRILHLGSDPTGTPSAIDDRAIDGCWFELHRQGGCGPGELVLKDDFLDRDTIELGDWIAFEFDTNERWYLGRVESRNADSPARIRYQLEGMGAELGEVFPGGFSREAADGVPPHRFARTDLFPHDPDYDSETVDDVSEPDALVDLLLNKYVVPKTHITAPASRIEASIPATSLESFKFRGEESVRSILKELGVRARAASWGVDEQGEFFFTRQRAATLVTLQEGVDLISLAETRDREFLFNRVVLTGGYVYNEPLTSGNALRGFYRWRGNYVQPDSRDLYGERRIRLWIPWIRTQADSLAFIREFFRTYAHPTSRFLVEFAGFTTLPKPWDGRFELLDRNGQQLVLAPVESIRIQFDQTPVCRAEVGPLDPRTHWPEPPQDERWELPSNRGQGDGGDIVSLTSLGSSSSLLSSQLSSSGSGLSSSGSASSGGSEFSSSGNPSSSASGPPQSSNSGATSQSPGSSFSGPSSGEAGFSSSGTPSGS